MYILHITSITSINPSNYCNLNDGMHYYYYNHWRVSFFRASIVVCCANCICNCNYNAWLARCVCVCSCVSMGIHCPAVVKVGIIRNAATTIVANRWGLNQKNQNPVFYAHVRLTISLSLSIIIFGFHIFAAKWKFHSVNWICGFPFIAPTMHCAVSIEIIDLNFIQFHNIHSMLDGFFLIFIQSIVDKPTDE